MNKEIEIYRKIVYGNELTYVKNKQFAEAIRILTNSKTISGHHARALEILGFTFIEVIAP